MIARGDRESHNAENITADTPPSPPSRSPTHTHTRRGGTRAKTQKADTAAALSKLTNLDRVSILAEALPYMQKFAGKTVVVKYGGAAMKDPTLKVRARVSSFVCLRGRCCCCAAGQLSPQR